MNIALKQGDEFGEAAPRMGISHPFVIPQRLRAKLMKTGRRRQQKNDQRQPYKKPFSSGRGHRRRSRQARIAVPSSKPSAVRPSAASGANRFRLRS